MNHLLQIISNLLIMKKQEAAVINIINKDGEQILKIKVMPEIEELFKDDETNTSEKYIDVDGDGLEFYNLKPRLKKLERLYERAMGQKVELERYGTSLFIDGDAYNGIPNLSILRTVGISDGIEVKVDETLFEEDLEIWGARAGKFIEFLYQKEINQADLRLTITIET